jgi:hypothetical protein
MTDSATHGGTYYVLRSRVMPGLYKPGIAHNFERRLQQHGGPDKWETVATFYLGPLIARGFELRMLRRFGHRRIAPHPEERMCLTDQELAQLLALAEEEQACADAARATVAAGNSTPTTPHAQRQLDHSARLAERGLGYLPPARPATTAAGAVFMGAPPPAVETPPPVAAPAQTAATELQEEEGQIVAAAALEGLVLLNAASVAVLAFVLIQFLGSLGRIHAALGAAGLMGLAAVPAAVAVRKVRRP